MILDWILKITFFLVCFGLLLHFKVDMPLLCKWIGSLPGDVLLRHEGRKIFFPLASAGISGTILMLLVHKKK